MISSGWERAYGRVVKIWHLNDLMTVYAHNLENLAKVGDWVEQGQVIATVGSTGRATAPHLHFEIRLNGRKYNPVFWLPEVDAIAAPVRDPRSPSRRRHDRRARAVAAGRTRIPSAGRRRTRCPIRATHADAGRPGRRPTTGRSSSFPPTRSSTQEEAEASGTGRPSSCT